MYSNTKKHLSLARTSSFITKLLCVLVVIMLFEAPVSAVSKGAYIHSGWKLARELDVTANGNTISQPGFNAASWVPAIVPGTVLTSYEKAGLIDDPYYSNNLQTLSQDYYNVNYWYRTEFQIPADMLGKRIWLNFDGVHWKADIYLNGTKIADLDGAFARGRYDITAYAKIGEANGLAVHLDWTDTQPVNAPTFICSAGWDWIPPIPGRNIGIYEDVFLSTTGDVTIKDPFIKTDLPLPDLSTADLSFSVELKNNTANEISGTLTAIIDSLGISIDLPVMLNASQQKTVFFDKDDYPELLINAPKLWWPNGYGQQNLNQLKLAFKVGNKVSDTEQTQFGIREYTYDMDGHELYLLVNGHKVMCKGGNWGMPDAMLKWEDKDFDTAVRLHKEMNFTMIRTWHGTSDFKAFYDACDKYGIMVFEDFWMNGFFGPEDPDMFMANAKDKIKRLRNRASIAIWCGENEAYPPEPIFTRLPAAYNELDGTRIYFHTSNHDGIHGGVTYAIQDPAWFFGAASGYTTEIGSPCVPSVESMRMMMDEDDLWPIGSVWEWHDWDQDIGNKLPHIYKQQVDERYGTAVGIEDFCQKAQMVNLETYKAIFESWNHKMWDDCGGALLWMSQSAWPSTIWQTYDYYFEGTGAYYGCKKACEPIHVQWDSYNGNVKVINNTRDDLSDLTVEAMVYNMDGSQVYDHQITDLTVTADTAHYCFDLLNVAGNNLALGKTATASSIEGDNTNRAPQYAVDGQIGTRWASNSSDPQWLCVDLGSVKNIESVIIRWEAAYASAYSIQISNDAQNWTTVYSTNSGNGQMDTINFNPVNARYVRMYGTRRGTYFGYSIFEFIVNETGTTPVPVEGLSPVHFIKLRLKDAQGKLLSDNFYWRGDTHLDYTALESMPDVDLNCSANLQQYSGKAILAATVTNGSDDVAVSIRLKLLRQDTGERVLPAIYDDNYFSLLPGESRVVNIEFETSLLGSQQPQLMVEGLNIVTEEVTINGDIVSCSSPLPLDVAGAGTVIEDLSAFSPEPDCIVNMYDFAVFAMAWLNSGNYPL